MIINNSAMKKTKYIYLTFFLIIISSLLISAKLTGKPTNDYLNVTQSFSDKTPIVYHDYYNIRFWGLEEFHPFDTKKYQRIFHELLQKSNLSEERVIVAAKPDKHLLSLAHDKKYLKSLNSSWTLARITELGFLRFFPSKLSRDIVLEPMLYQTGGSLLAAMAAMEQGWAINLGGGYHHASYKNGEGFCALADIGLIVRYLRQAGKVNNVMIIDLDAHQGNGHELDFIGDKNTYILDAYNKEIYPHDIVAKSSIDIKIELLAFSSDKIFLERLEKALPTAFHEFQPDLIIYIAGTDILDGDPLGALAISPEGIIKRDEMVFRLAIEKQIPIVMLLGGGYQQSNAHIIAQSILNLRDKFDLF